MTKAITTIDIKEFPLLSSGKVREIFDLGEQLIIVATDRLSAFDVILPSPIPERGKVLTALSCFWFGTTEGIVPNHLVSCDVSDFPDEFLPYKESLEGRTMLVRRAERIDVECIVRGYLAGSGWQEYQKTGRINDIILPNGLSEAEKLPEPIFTPTTKAEKGHDMPITFESLHKAVGDELATALRDTSIKLYFYATEYALKRGIIIADTKFEFGFIEGKLTLIDEALTPDSSRFWVADDYRVGETPDPFDKELVRSYLRSVGFTGGDNPPELPDTVIRETLDRYRWAAEKLMR